MPKSIDAVINAYENAWNAMDFAALATLWHAREDDLYYVAEEAEKPFYNMRDIQNYWAITEVLVESVELSTTERRTKQLTADIAVVTFNMHMNAQLKGHTEQNSQRIGVDVRVSTILKETADGWRFIHYVEAPLGALPFVRKAYRSNAR